MPILNGFEATQEIRKMEQAGTTASRVDAPRRLSHQLNGRIPIFAVSASLREAQYTAMRNYGLDGWLLKPIDFKRLSNILKGINDLRAREENVYQPGGSWEAGGWLHMPSAQTAEN